MTTNQTFEWSSRNIVGKRWRTFYSCKGQGFNYGNKVDYGYNDWNTEEQAIAAQQRWEKRIEGVHVPLRNISGLK